MRIRGNGCKGSSVGRRGQGRAPRGGCGKYTIFSVGAEGLPSPEPPRGPPLLRGHGPRPFRAVAEELQPAEPLVGPVGGEQFLVAARLHHPAVLDDVDPVPVDSRPFGLRTAPSRGQQPPSLNFAGHHGSTYLRADASMRTIVQRTGRKAVQTMSSSWPKGTIYSNSSGFLHGLFMASLVYVLYSMNRWIRSRWDILCLKRKHLILDSKTAILQGAGWIASGIHNVESHQY